MTVIDDVVTELETEWDAEVTDSPHIDNGHKHDELNKKNWCWVYNEKSESVFVSPNRDLVDRVYNIKIYIGSDSEGKRDNIHSEVERIIAAGISGYDNWSPTASYTDDNNEVYQTVVNFQLKTYNESFP